jgi:hypothetical protein
VGDGAFLPAAITQVSPEAKDLVAKLLVVDPAQRLTCEQARPEEILLASMMMLSSSKCFGGAATCTARQHSLGMEALAPCPHACPTWPAVPGSGDVFRRLPQVLAHPWMQQPPEAGREPLTRTTARIQDAITRRWVPDFIAFGYCPAELPSAYAAVCWPGCSWNMLGCMLSEPSDATNSCLLCNIGGLPCPGPCSNSNASVKGTLQKRISEAISAASSPNAPALKARARQGSDEDDMEERVLSDAVAKQQSCIMGTMAKVAQTLEEGQQAQQEGDGAVQAVLPGGGHG